MELPVLMAFEAIRCLALQHIVVLPPADVKDALQQGWRAGIYIGKLTCVHMAVNQPECPDPVLPEVRVWAPSGAPVIVHTTCTKRTTLVVYRDRIEIINNDPTRENWVDESPRNCLIQALVAMANGQRVAEEIRAAAWLWLHTEAPQYPSRVESQYLTWVKNTL